jgi:UDP-N-acetylglucosamine acyltransferase
MRRLRRAYLALFSGSGHFAERLEAVSREFSGDPLVGKVIAFIGAGGVRALAHPPLRRGAAAPDADAEP